jgi:hypothetical protein
MEWRQGDTTVRWLQGGLLVRWGDDAFVLDAPPAVVQALGADLPLVRAVVLSGGRASSVGGLVPLLSALAPHRDGAPLDLRLVLGEERGAALAETWVRAWGQPYPLVVDAERPGGVLELGPVEVELVPMKAGEWDWGEGRVRSRVQVALRVRTPDARLVWVPGSAPGTAVVRVCDGADLVVLEVGLEPWPRHEGRWRLTTAEALGAAGEAELWLVGDDGQPLDLESS